MKSEHINELNSNKKIYNIILIICGIGLLIPFAGQVILPVFISDININGLDQWNQFTSIVLGIVATISGIMSLVSGEKSSSQMQSFKDDNNQILSEMRITLGKIETIVTNIDKNTPGGNIKTETVNVDSQNWNNKVTNEI